VESLAGVLTIVFLFGSPAILIALGMLRGHVNQRHLRRERTAARRMYERVMHHKLEVIETALAMGYTVGEVRDLDARLERLIGAERMQALLDERTPGLPTTGELPSDDDLKSEIAAMRKERERV
jgi:hypothetical protein